MIRSTNTIRRFQASTRDHFSSDGLGFIRITSSVMHLFNFLSFARMFTQVPIMSITRSTQDVLYDQRVTRVTRRAMEVNEMEGSSKAINQDLLSCSRIYAYPSINRMYYRRGSDRRWSFRFRAGELFFVVWGWGTILGFMFFAYRISTLINCHRFRFIQCPFLCFLQILGRWGTFFRTGRCRLTISMCLMTSSTQFRVLCPRASVSTNTPSTLASEDSLQNGNVRIRERNTR